MSRELTLEPLHEQSRLLSSGELSSEELVRAVIDRTEALEPQLNSYITFTPDRALGVARERDQERARGESRGPLHGIPVSLKDVFDTKDLPTSAGARFLAGERPPQDSEVARRLERAGAVLLGKANLNKFAGGESGENPDFGDMFNPWNTRFSPSGSSGGSAAQVSAGLVSLSVGSDNGGSIRNPASVCNVTGLKPTHGRISTEGMFPRAYTVDHAGPITRSVRDSAIALNVLAGHRGGDATTARREVPDHLAALEGPVAGLKVGVDRANLKVGEPVVLQTFERALQELAELEVEIREVTLPTPEEMTPVMYTIFFCEWGTAHERWLKERPEEYGGLGSRAALLIPAVDYLKAQRERQLFARRAAEAMQAVDLVASPTYPMRRREHRALPIVNERRLTLDDALRYTMPFDLLGLPAVSIPGGFSDDGFPIGFQLAGRAFAEPLLLRLAHAYEQSAGWIRRHPPI